MASIVSRSANIATSIKATSQVVASSVRLPAPSVLAKDEKVVALKSPLSSSSIPSSYAGSLPFGALKISSGIGAGTQVRYAHTDLQIPNFDEVHRPKTRDPKSKSEDTAVSRHAFTYLISGSSILVGVYATKHIVRGAVSTLSASKDVLALAKIEIKTDDIPEGKSMTFKWRGKPIFVKHRTEAEIEIERSVDLSSLRDPQHDNDRIQDPKWLVVIGVCTHLGCVPIANAGEYGGYYCPCHGSHYDGSGRIRKGPAPLNLEVPEYSFPEPGLLVVG